MTGYKEFNSLSDGCLDACNYCPDVKENKELKKEIEKLKQQLQVAVEVFEKIETMANALVVIDSKELLDLVKQINEVGK